ncbi:hypothetical protein AX15_000106 [Amanita polypyramis BW_CC]|nr:hypothetical protein AX15_000106 [Amanita polypyramis BW_CC]
MRSLISLPLFITLLDLATNAYGLKVSFDVHINNVSTRLGRRAPIPVTNTGNAQYSANMTIGGVQVRVLLDTGSSDLWVNFPSQPPSTTDLGKSITLDYAIGRASGNVHATQVGFGNYTLDNQAFLLVTDTTTFTSNIHAQGYDGLFGLGNNDGSVIHKKLDNSVGDTFLNRIFSQDKQSTNYITFLLDRKFDPADTLKGQLTISELIPGLEQIASVPKLDVDKVNRLLKGDQHWQALTDKNIGIIGPDGQPIQIKSIVPNAPSGELVAVFDSGFTFSQVPRSVSDAIYGRVQGAQYDVQNQYWTVPCGQYLNISFNFGGVNYPVHPLDTVDDSFHITNSNGDPVCIGAFQPITTAFSILGHYDMILGMNFLRNVYTLFDYGDWASSNSNSRGTPYIQLMSTTNVQQVQQDFIQVRLNRENTLNDPRWALLPTSQMQHSPVSEAEKKQRYQEMILSRWPYIFLGCLVLVLLMVGVCIWKCCCRRGADGRRRCICFGKNKKSQLEKVGLAPPGTVGSEEAIKGNDAIQPMYIPLEDQQSYGGMSKPVSSYNSYGRPYSAGSIVKMPPPPATYGSQYDDVQSSSVPPYQDHLYANPNGSYSPYTSQTRLVQQELPPQHFPGGFPPGLGQGGQVYGAPYRESNHGHPPNSGYGRGYSA